MTKKVFFTKSAIKWVDWGNPTVKEVQYTGADWNQYTWIEFEWLASTPALDKGGDIVMDGAFDEYLDEFKEIWAPMLLQHDHDKPKPELPARILHPVKRIPSHSRVYRVE